MSATPGAKSLTLGEVTFFWGRQTYVMGILNVTPDSFSGDGLVAGKDGWIAAAVERGKQMERDGAHIIDVGGESTRPGATPVSEEEEIARVLPVIQLLSKEVHVPLSIDTYKARVAREAVAAGASVINDVWGLRKDPHMARAVAETNAAVILVHNRSGSGAVSQAGNLGSRYEGTTYDDLIADIQNELQSSVALARAAGVGADRIIVDPGLGFGKTVEQNLEIIRRLDEFTHLGAALLVGPSRKSFVGYVLDTPPQERTEGTAAIVALCIAQGANIVRVHDVKEMRRVTKMADAVVRSPAT